MNPYALFIAYSILMCGIAFSFGKFWERNRQAKMRKIRPHSISFNPSADITFN